MPSIIRGMGIRKETIEDVYYVDEESGSNSNSGKLVSAPFLTIAYALSVCDDDYTDDAITSIYIKPGNYDEDDLLFAGHGLRLIGLGVPGRDSGVHVVGVSGATYGILCLAAANVEVANICFEAEGAQPVLYGVAMDNCWIHDCSFYAKGATTLDCMELKDTRNSLIERNKFFSFKEKGIHCITGADKYLIETTIKDNVFASSSEGTIGSGAKGIFIHTDVVTYGTVIENNKILMGEVAGSPIGIDNDSVTAGGVMICNNYVMVPNGKTPIESASSPDGIIGNHTLAGATIVDPNPAATS